MMAVFAWLYWQTKQRADRYEEMVLKMTREIADASSAQRASTDANTFATRELNQNVIGLYDKLDRYLTRKRPSVPIPPLPPRRGDPR
jgi:hypothetical protein